MKSLAAVLVVLLCASAALVHFGGFGPATPRANFVEPLIPKAQSAPWTVAAVTVARRGESPFLFARQGGRWRAMSHGRALVAEGAVEQLLNDLLDAQVSARGKTAQLDDYGLRGVPAVYLELHGPKVLSQPDRDVLFRLDVGQNLPGYGSCFVRIPGREGVFDLELDLVERLSSPAGEPPLLERQLLPSTFEARTVGVDQVLVDRSDGGGLALVREARAGGFQQDVEWVWRLERQNGTGLTDAEEGLAALYLNFLWRAEFSALMPASEVDPELAKSPLARIQVYPTGGGEPLELALLPALPDGRRVVLQGRDRLVLEVSAPLADVLAARYEHLLDITTTPPWDRWLRVTLPQSQDRGPR